MYNIHQTLETPPLYYCEGAWIAIKSIDFLPKSPSIFKALVRLPQDSTITSHGHAEVLITSEPVYLGTNQSRYVTLYGRSREWYLYQD